MLPPLWPELASNAASTHYHYLSTPHDVPYSRNWYACKHRGNALAAGCGKQQFVVLSAVKRNLQIHFVRRFADAGPRDGIAFDFSPHPAAFAKVGPWRGHRSPQL